MTTLPLIDVNDDGPTWFSKVNAAIALANDLVAALSEEGGYRETGDQSVTGLVHDETGARETAVSSLSVSLADLNTALNAKANTSALADLASVLATKVSTADLEAQGTALERETSARQASIAGILRVLFNQAARPGDTPQAFTASLSGDPASASSLDPSGCVADPLGKAYVLIGEGIVAPKEAVWLEPGGIFVVRCIFRRLTNPAAMVTAKVLLGAQWLDAGYAPVGQSVIQVIPTFLVKNGRQVIQIQVPSRGSTVPQIAAPAGAVYWRPYLKTYGPDGRTAVESLLVSDATTAGAWSPDVSDLTARIAAIESLVNGGNPINSVVEIPVYGFGNLPPAGTPGRKAYVADGCALLLGGGLEPVGQGSGVEATDNGAEWRVSGTNILVRA